MYSCNALRQWPTGVFFALLLIGAGHSTRAADYAASLVEGKGTEAKQVTGAIKEALADRPISIMTMRSKGLSADGPALRNTDCLILSPNAIVPQKAKKRLDAFLKRGGDVVFLGGDSLRRSTIRFPEAFPKYSVYTLSDVRQIKPWLERTDIASGFDWSGQTTGRSAVAIDMPNRSEFFPLLATYDRYGRRTGWAGGVKAHYNGKREGSQWALFGVKNADFYQSADFKTLLPRLLDHFRNGTFIKKAASANQAALDKTIETTAEPLPPLELDKKRGQFVRPNGEPFYAMGANIVANGGLVHRWWGGFRVDVVKHTFKRMHDAGLNAARLFGFGALDHLDVLLEYARRYNIYLIIHLGQGETKKEQLEQARKRLEKYAGVNLVLGYDLRNEPYFWEVGKFEDAGQKLLTRFPAAGGDGTWKPFKAYLKHAGLMDWRDKNTFPKMGSHMPEPANDRQWQAFKAVNNMFDTWLGWHEKAVDSLDPDRPITVGYNTVWSCLPANRRLDFLSNHVYLPPHSVKQVRLNLTTMDRLRRVWPHKPVSLGEFGLSNGRNLANGKPIDPHSSAVGEMMYYLHALANDHMGVFKWQLFDFPIHAHRSLASWRKDAKWIKLRGQSRFGMYYFDGTPGGAPKPIVPTLKFLRGYLDENGARGRFKLLKAPNNSIKTGYRFQSDDALFVGHRRWQSERLRFDTGDAVPTNVMLRWQDGTLTLMSSRDLNLRLRPGGFLSSVTSKPSDITGDHGKHRWQDGWLTVQLLAGEPIDIHHASD
jgi:hypothetical protein